MLSHGDFIFCKNAFYDFLSRFYRIEISFVKTTILNLLFLESDIIKNEKNSFSYNANCYCGCFL